jgi:hypothetical protein
MKRMAWLAFAHVLLVFSPGNAKVPQTTISAPSNFTGTELSSTSIQWSWDAVLGSSTALGATHYELQAETSNAVIASISGPGTTPISFTEANLTPGNTYCRHVVAFNGSEGSSTIDICITLRKQKEKKCKLDGFGLVGLNSEAHLSYQLGSHPSCDLEIHPQDPKGGAAEFISDAGTSRGTKITVTSDGAVFIKGTKASGLDKDGKPKKDVRVTCTPTGGTTPEDLFDFAVMDCAAEIAKVKFEVSGVKTPDDPTYPNPKRNVPRRLFVFSGSAKFEADVKIIGNDDDAKQWRVGFVQNILINSGQNTYSDGNVVSHLPFTPILDGNRNAPLPFADKDPTVKDFTAGNQTVKISGQDTLDSTAEWNNPGKTGALQASSRHLKFRTWIVAQHKDGCILKLFDFTWTADYDTSEVNIKTGLLRVADPHGVKTVDANATGSDLMVSDPPRAGQVATFEPK